jgi:hypothetical protein
VLPDNLEKRQNEPQHPGPSDAFETILERWRLFFVLGVTLIEIFLFFGRWYSDSGFYSDFSLTANAPAYVAIRFMVPVLARPLVPLVGGPDSVAFVNSILWIVGVLVAYNIGMILQGKNGALLVALFFTTSVSMLAYGAAVLTDSAGYLFVGLGLLLVLKKPQRKTRAGLEGAALQLGSFFHPTSLLGLIFLLGYRLRRLWFLLATLLGAVIVLAAVAILAYAYGMNEFILHNVLPNVLNVFTQQALLRPSTGPDILQGFAWTFGVSAPVQAIAHFILTGPQYGSILDVTRALWFLAIAVIGFRYTNRKAPLAIYSLILAAFPLAAHQAIERYLFTMWPALVPMMVEGIRKLGEIGPLVCRPALRRTHVNVIKTILRSPDFYALVYILLQGTYNTVAVLNIHPVA